MKGWVFFCTLWSLARSLWMSVYVQTVEGSMEFLSIPNLCCSSVMCMAGCETHGALAYSLVPAAFASAKFGLCMILINTK